MIKNNKASLYNTLSSKNCCSMTGMSTRYNRGTGTHPNSRVVSAKKLEAPVLQPGLREEEQEIALKTFQGVAEGQDDIPYQHKIKIII